MNELTPTNEFEEEQSPPKWRVEITDEMLRKVAAQERIMDIIEGNFEQTNISAKVYLWDEIVNIYKANIRG